MIQGFAPAKSPAVRATSEPVRTTHTTTDSDSNKGSRRQVNIQAAMDAFNKSWTSLPDMTNEEETHAEPVNIQAAMESWCRTWLQPDEDYSESHAAEPPEKNVSPFLEACTADPYH